MLRHPLINMFAEGFCQSGATVLLSNHLRASRQIEPAEMLLDVDVRYFAYDLGVNLQLLELVQ